RAPLAHGFRLVARADELRPRLAPIIRPFGFPGEIGRAQQAQQSPVGIVRPVAGEAEFATGPDDAGELCDTLVIDESPLPVPPLRPWVRIEQIHARDRGI